MRTRGGLRERLHPSSADSLSQSAFLSLFALERGVVDCAVTVTARAWRALDESPTPFALRCVGFAAYGVNLAWGTIRSTVRDFLQKVMTEVQETQWKLGLELTEDGIACNAGQKDGCNIGRVVENSPMTITRATDADRATLKSSLTAVVLPAWIKRCGERCGEI